MKALDWLIGLFGRERKAESMPWRNYDKVDAGITPELLDDIYMALKATNDDPLAKRMNEFFLRTNPTEPGL